MDEIFNTTSSFADLGLNEALARALQEMKFEHPTKVQADVIPVALTGRDVLAQSKTGTGKTAAFGLPLLQRLDPEQAFSTLVLVPTRELAIQVTKELREIARFMEASIVAVYGGQSIRIQAERLRKGPQVIVGTPGRIMDFHRRGQLPYDTMRFAVLDEVDRMLDIGFRDDIRQILGRMKQKHQTVFVSATISPEIDRLARQYLDNPAKLVLTAGSLTVSQVDQSYLTVERWDKNRLLIFLLKREKPDLGLIFCRTKQTVDALARYLERKGIDAHAIHGDMYQGKRNRVMNKFRAGEMHVLVASDLAARGLDVDGISHVINYDLPEDPEVYVHRIGRTARTGRRGTAWSFVTPDQGDLLSSIEKLTNVEIVQQRGEGFQPGPVPDTVAIQRARDEERREGARHEHSRVTQVPPSKKAATDPSKFPGGIVPKALPGKRMGGRFRSRRGGK